jgi:predicted O-methyltransferase YrrM
MRCKNFVFEELAERARDPKEKALYKYMKLHHLVMGMERPTVLEFGVSKGLSTCLIGTALETVGGQLVSVDILDCSDVIQSDKWTFVQGDDLDVGRILAAAPVLEDGVDLLYLDSRHTREHVTAQLLAWYPYVKPGGAIAFDDIDPAPYQFQQRKQDYRLARDCEAIARAIREFFFANEDSLLLEYHFGSTGLAIMRKFSPLRTAPISPRRPAPWPLRFVLRGRLDSLLHALRDGVSVSRRRQAAGGGGRGAS